MGAVIENRWCERLRDRIRSFATDYSQRLALGKAQKVKALNDSLTCGGGASSLEIGLDRQALELESATRAR